MKMGKPSPVSPTKKDFEWKNHHSNHYAKDAADDSDRCAEDTGYDPNQSTGNTDPDGESKQQKTHDQDGGGSGISAARCHGKTV